MKPTTIDIILKVVGALTGIYLGVYVFTKCIELMNQQGHNL